MKRVVVFASGRGSNFKSLLKAKKDGRIEAEFVALVCDQPKAPVIELAKAAGVATQVIPFVPDLSAGIGADRLRQRSVHEQAILDKILPLKPDFAVMAGYMRILSKTLLSAFRSPQGYYRVVNVHPSLLPSFPGVAAYRQAFDHGVKQTGVTVHLVDEELDHGPICDQKSFSIEDCSTAEEVERKGLSIEHALYPEVLSWVLKEDFEILIRGVDQRKVVIRKNSTRPQNYVMK